MSGQIERIPILIALLFLAAAVLPMMAPASESILSAPSRGMEGYRETLNVSFPKPEFYTDQDPHYSQNNLEANTWEDIAFVVLLQNKDRIKIKENQGTQSGTAKCGDIYQAAFVTIDGKKVSTGTQQRIIVEDFTATWCGYCTGVIGAMNRLDMDGTMFPDNYIGVEWHSGGGTYGTGEPLANAVERRDSYEISGGIPRYIIDGMDPWVGGSGSANESSIDNRIRNSISNRDDTAPISLVAHGGHTSSSAWVEFTFTVESETFDNRNVEAHVFLIQDAYPRRHGTNPNARLGWIGQDLYTQKVMQLESPLVQFKESRMLSEINEKGYVQEEFDIEWQASDKEDGTLLNIDLYYRQGRDDWVEIATSVPNTGRYSWDTMDPRIPDEEDYYLKIMIVDSDGLKAEVETDLRFEINNPDPPTIAVTEPTEIGTIMTGTGEVRWRTWDDEQDTTEITIDLSISSDGGENYELLGTNLENTGSFTWDTMTFADGAEYTILLRATDITGLFSETGTLLFEVFNNDVPTGTITFPEDGSEVGGEIEITWDSLDEEDEAKEMKYDLYIMYLDDGIWIKLASDQMNTGSFTLDTTTLEFGDGDHRLRLILRDSNGAYSDPNIIDMEIYNPDAPVISNTISPRSPLSGTASFGYMLSDPDRGETPLLSPSFLISSDGSTWEDLLLSSANTGTFDLDVSNMEDREYQLKITVADPKIPSLVSEFIYPAFEVNNPDAPEIEWVSLPSAGDNVTGELSLSWSGSDKDGDVLKYYISYSPEGDPGWYPVSDAQGMTSSSYVWNTSDLDSGNYQIKVLVRDGSKDTLETEIATDTFRIYVLKEVEDKNSETGNGKSGSIDDGNNNSLFILLAAGIAVILILLTVMIVIVMVRRRQQPLMMAPPMVPQMGGVQSGQYLPPQQAGQQRARLPPPAAVPQGPLPQAPAPMQTPAAVSQGPHPQVPAAPLNTFQQIPAAVPQGPLSQAPAPMQAPASVPPTSVAPITQMPAPPALPQRRRIIRR
ncbi:MAG: hypothetical protein U9R75_11735 [Candidatus Thermoplasmatota archaeon]|nr:hypothetical protein [Candidatus Thermoplasmatota archaeon]